MKEQFADHFFWALWYNGLEDDIEQLARRLEDAKGWFGRSDAGIEGESIELLWMILVQRFGDYGTSPRSGWIEDTEGAAMFLYSRMTRTWKQDDDG